MTIRQTRQICVEVFYTLSDEIKIRMHNQQFSIEDDDWEDVYGWLDENTSDPYYIEGGDDEKRWVLLYSELDAMAFKLRWL